MLGILLLSVQFICWLYHHSAQHAWLVVSCPCSLLFCKVGMSNKIACWSACCHLFVPAAFDSAWHQLCRAAVCHSTFGILCIQDLVLIHQPHLLDSVWPDYESSRQLGYIVCLANRGGAACVSGGSHSLWLPVSPCPAQPPSLQQPSYAFQRHVHAFCRQSQSCKLHCIGFV